MAVSTGRPWKEYDEPNRTLALFATQVDPLKTPLLTYEYYREGRWTTLAK